ncbi:MAG: type II secretion system protein [Sedimentisphaeraceae bacterium JB056]
MQRNKKAFTLIELLVVISIIAVLMSIMMPALAKAREQAKKILGAARQKDVGLALNLYSQDWDGALPKAYWSKVPGSNYTRLPYKLAPYYDQDQDGTSSELFSFELYSCPAQPKWLTNSEGEKVERGKSAVGSYGYNYFFFYGVNPGGKFSNMGDWVERNVSHIRDGATLPLFGCVSGEEYEGLGAGGGQVLDYRGPHPKAFKYGYMGGKSPATVSKTSPSGPAPNHGRDCNMLMADYHVEAVNVCVDGEFPWTDHTGSAFHPSRASVRGNEKK